MDGYVYSTLVHSFTHGTDYNVVVSCDYLSAADTVLIVDDFLANGEAATGASRLIEQSGAELAGIGILIEKSFQNGRKRLEDAGYYVYSQARIRKLGNGVIEFLSDDEPVISE